MTHAVEHAQIVARATAMRDMGLVQREYLIAAADNVIGYERFIERRHQVDLRSLHYGWPSP